MRQREACVEVGLVPVFDQRARLRAAVGSEGVPRSHEAIELEVRCVHEASGDACGGLHDEALVLLADAAVEIRVGEVEIELDADGGADRCGC